MKYATSLVLPARLFDRGREAGSDSLLLTAIDVGIASFEKSFNHPQQPFSCVTTVLIEIS